MSEMRWFHVNEILEWDSVDRIFVDKKSKSIIPLLIKKAKEDANFNLIKESLIKFGFIKPLRFTVQNNKIIHGDGHHRLAAAIELGYDYIPYVEDSELEEDCWHCISNEEAQHLMKKISRKKRNKITK